MLLTNVLANLRDAIARHQVAAESSQRLTAILEEDIGAVQGLIDAGCQQVAVGDVVEVYCGVSENHIISIKLNGGKGAAWLPAKVLEVSDMIGVRAQLTQEHRSRGWYPWDCVRPLTSIQ